jgi:hypothetical protein
MRRNSKDGEVSNRATTIEGDEDLLRQEEKWKDKSITSSNGKTIHSEYSLRITKRAPHTLP